MTDIEAGNKIIAEFVGGKKKMHPHGFLTMGYKFPFKISHSNWWADEALSFHKSWDWLMPACKKFDNLNLFDTEYEKLCDEIDLAVSCYEIKPAFENLVKAIEWYNNNQKQTAP